MELIADTTVLIDIWRFRRSPARMADLVKKSKGASLVVPWITEAEFSRGALYKGVGKEALEAFYGGFLRLPLNRKTMDSYRELWGGDGEEGQSAGLPRLVDCGERGGDGLSCLDAEPRPFFDGAGTGGRGICSGIKCTARAPGS